MSIKTNFTQKILNLNKRIGEYRLPNSKLMKQRQTTTKHKTINRKPNNNTHSAITNTEITQQSIKRGFQNNFKTKILLSNRQKEIFSTKCLRMS